MAYYIKRTTKFYGAEPFAVVVNDYSTKEIAEKALAYFRSQKPHGSGTEYQYFYIAETV